MSNEGTKALVFFSWDVLVVISIIPSTFLVVYQASFDATVGWHWALTYSGDVLFITWIVLNCLRSYTNKRGEEIRDQEMIIIHYALTSFAIDLISVLPFEMFAVIGGLRDLGYVVAVLRLNRTLRVYRVWAFLHEQERKLSTNSILMKSIRMAFLAAVSIHFAAASWFTIACTNTAVVKKGGEVCLEDSWASGQSIDWNIASSGDKYTVSLYWAVTTLTTVGYGDITPSTDTEKWIALLWMLWGVALFAYILGVVAAMLATADAQRTCYIHHLNVIREQLDDANATQAMKKNVIGYYAYMWKESKGKSVTEFFDRLPLALQAEVQLESYKGLLEKTTIFCDLPDKFLRMLCMSIKPALYLPHQVIVRKGGTRSTLYVVQQGEVEVLEDWSSPPIRTLREGDTFGERSVVQGGGSGEILRARTHCRVLTLARGDLLSILHHFPNEGRNLKHKLTKSPGKWRSDDETSLLSQHSRRTMEARPAQNSLRIWSCLTRPFMPDSYLLMVWDVVIVAIILAVSIIYTYQAAFTHFNPREGYVGSVQGTVLLVFTYLMDCVLIVDIFISMKRAVHTHTQMIMKPRAILVHYLLSPWFVLDVLAMLPLEIAGIYWIPTAQEWKYIPLLRLNRLLKYWKVISFFRSIEQSLHISIAYLTLLKYIVHIFTAQHISACLWFVTACYSEDKCVKSSWAEFHGITMHSTAWQDYLASLYWSIATMTTVGYGDIRAYNTREMLVSMAVQLVGVLLYGYCLGAVAAILTNIAIPRVSFQERLLAVNQFMKEHGMGGGLKKRVNDSLALLWSQYKGACYPGEEGVFQDMPPTTRKEVCLKGYGPLLIRIPFLSGISPAFLRELSTLTSLHLFAPGDIVLYGGDMGRAMYCIRKGYVELLSEDMFHVVRVLGPGTHFGDIGFLFGVPRLYTARAATHCQLLMIRWRDMERLLQQFPEIKRMFDQLSVDLDLLALAQGAVMAGNGRAMVRPIQFSSPPSVMGGLAVAMATPLSVVFPTSLSNSVVACVDGKEAQIKITAPISVNSGPKEGLLIRHERVWLRDWLQGRHGEGEEEARKKRRRRRRRGNKRWAGERMELLGSEYSRVRREDYEEEEDEDEEGPEDRRYVDVLKQCIRKLQRIFSYCLFPCSIHPESKIFQYKEVVSVFLAVLMVMVVSLQAAFLPRSHALWFLSYTLDLYFIAEMLVNMHVAYYDDSGLLVTHPMACIAHYLKTGFAIDLLSSFPTDILVTFAWGASVASVYHLLAVVRINRLLKLYKLPLAFKALETKISVPMGPIKIFEFFMYMFVGTHLTACAWYVLGCPAFTFTLSPCGEDGWATYYSSIESLAGMSFFHQYFVSLYWATATTTTVGYGDIRAHTHLERAYASLVMLFGVVAYGYLAASVTANLMNADSARAQYQAKLQAVKAYLRDYKVDSTLRKRVINYYEYLWKHNKGVRFEDLFQGLPMALQVDTSISLYKPIIDKVPLFDNTELGFCRLLALSIKPIIFLKDDYIVRKGDVGAEMFFIYRGSVEIVSEDGEVTFALMQEGQFFGEISLFFECPRTASIRAATTCALFVLTKTDLKHVLSYYPHIRQQIREVAGKRADIARRRSLIASQAASRGLSPRNAAWEAAQLTADEESEEGVVYHPQSLKKKKSKTFSQVFKEQVESEGLLMAWLKRLLLLTVSHDGYLGVAIFWVGCLLSYYSFFTISYQAAFQDYSWGLWLINYLIEAYFLAEVFLKLHLTYADHHGNIVSDKKTIILHYLKSPEGLLLDCFSLFPCELLVLPIPNRELRVAMVLYMRLPHLARVIRVKWMFDTQEKYLNQNTVLIQLCKSTVLLSLSTHFVACCWYFLACRVRHCHENSWASMAGLQDPITPSSFPTTTPQSPTHPGPSHYTTSFYWAVTTMTTVGYGDLSATNLPEMVFAVLVMIGGKLLFGFILGTVASTLANLESSRIEYEDKLKALKASLKRQHVSHSTRQRVARFLEYSWLRNTGTDRQDLLTDFPYCLRAEVALDITETMIRSVKVFRALELPFLRRLAVLLKPCLFLPGEVIVHKGDLGFGVFFLYHGQVEFLGQDEEDTSAADPTNDDHHNTGGHYTEGAEEEEEEIYSTPPSERPKDTPTDTPTNRGKGVGKGAAFKTRAKQVYQRIKTKGAKPAQHLGKGSSFGVKSLLYCEPAGCTVRAVEHVDLFSFTSAEFITVLQDFPRAAADIEAAAFKEYRRPLKLL